MSIADPDLAQCFSETLNLCIKEHLDGITELVGAAL